MITFRESDHTYWADGARVPSVTQVMSMLIDFRWVPQEILDRKSELGKAVHLMIHLYEHGDLDIATLDPALISYLERWQEFVQQSGWETWDSERLVFSKRYRYAGTLDLCGTLAGKFALIDLKTTAVLHPAVGLQTAGYANALQEETGRTVQARYALSLNPDGFSLRPCEDRNDLSVFLSCLTLNNWRLNNAA